MELVQVSSDRSAIQFQLVTAIFFERDQLASVFNNARQRKHEIQQILHEVEAEKRPLAVTVEVPAVYMRALKSEKKIFIIC